MKLITLNPRWVGLHNWSSDSIYRIGISFDSPTTGRRLAELERDRERLEVAQDRLNEIALMFEKLSVKESNAALRVLYRELAEKLRQPLAARQSAATKETQP